MSNLSPGLKMKLKRVEKGLSQEQLATLAGISKLTVARYEKNERDPKISIIKKLCEALELDVRELLV
jgi:putative transcriptional regulator